jgi:predicted Holliday junction resolvase-like endonuclease
MSFFSRMYNVLAALPPSVQAFLFFAAAVLAAAAAFAAGRYKGRSETSRAAEEEMRRVRSDAVKRSRAVLGGQLAEQVAPFLPGFPCNPADVRFIGKPVDFIGFPGAAEGKEIKEILFIEVKSGSSVLSRREREIKHAVQTGCVRYVEYREPGSDAASSFVSSADSSPLR